jgi:O-antigen/teichoic acid export membrane protein
LENIKKGAMLKVPAKATVWYVGSGAMARAIGALSTPIFTRLLTPGEYGLYPLYNTWIGVLSVLVTLEITGSAIYRGFQRYEDNREDFITAALGLLGVVFVGFCALYFAFYGVLGRFIGLDLRVSILMFAQIFATSVISLYLAKARFEYKYKAVAILNLLSAALIPITAVLMILLTDIRAEARIYASSAVTLLIAIPISVLIIRGSEKLYSAKIWRYLLGHSIPLLPHYFATALILKASEISINRNYGTEALGQYSIAMSVGMILTIVTGGVLSALTPWLIRKIREGGIDKVREFLLLVTRTLSLLSLLILAFAPELLAFLAAEGFREALPAVYPLEIAVIFSFLSSAVMSGCTYYERGGIASVPSLVSALTSVLLSLFILPRMDYRLASFIALTSYFILFLFTTLVFKKLSGEYPLNFKKCAIPLLLALSYAVLLFVFRDILLSRIFLAIPLIPLLILSTKDIWLRIKE